MNKFCLTGLPRSGTTFFLKTLREQPNIYVPKPNIHFEPFATLQHNFHISFDENIARMSPPGTADYFGFKCFPTHSNNMVRLFEDGYQFFVLLRKDFWKVFGSVSTGAQDNHFHESSRGKKIAAHDLKTFVKNHTNLACTLLQNYYDFEMWYRNHYRTIDVLYFEDLIKPDATFESVNKYFDQEIIFNANYVDDGNPDDYFPDPLYKIMLRAHVKNRLVIPSDMPQYILDSFNS